MKTTKLRIQTGHPVTADVQEIKADRIRIVDENERCLFEVSLQDGYIEIQQIDHHILNDAIYGGGIVVAPRACNQIEVRTPFYAKRNPPATAKLATV